MSKADLIRYLLVCMKPGAEEARLEAALLTESRTKLLKRLAVLSRVARSRYTCIEKYSTMRKSQLVAGILLCQTRLDEFQREGYPVHETGEAKPQVANALFLKAQEAARQRAEAERARAEARRAHERDEEEKARELDRECDEGELNGFCSSTDLKTRTAIKHKFARRYHPDKCLAEDRVEECNKKIRLLSACEAHCSGGQRARHSRPVGLLELLSES